MRNTIVTARITAEARIVTTSETGIERFFTREL